MGHLILGNWEPRTFNNLEVCVHGECDVTVTMNVRPRSLLSRFARFVEKNGFQVYIYVKCSLNYNYIVCVCTCLFRFSFTDWVFNI